MLEIRGLDVAYGDVPVLSGVGLHVGEGEIVALLGPNGAGKSSLLGCVAGLVRPRAGSIAWEGRDLLTVAPHLMVEHGLAVVPEGRRLFGGMTVEENLELGAFAPAPAPRGGRAWPACSPSSRIWARAGAKWCAGSRAASSRWWRSAAR